MRVKEEDEGENIMREGEIWMVTTWSKCGSKKTKSKELKLSVLMERGKHVSREQQKWSKSEWVMESE